MLGIIDYGMGNIASVKNALDYLGMANRIVTDPREVGACDRLVLPGVGAFGQAMRKITATGFGAELQEFALILQRPVLGICLGMQILLESSVEHGFSAGLGLVSGQVGYLGDRIGDLPIPHVGWNEVSCAPSCRLTQDISEPDRVFYFVHSYYCQLAQRQEAKGQTSYGIQFDVMLEAGNICGVQFHPEKSQKSGLALLNNFGKL